MNTHTPATQPAAIITSDPTHGIHKCRSCGRSIFWRYHERTRNLAPIDVTPIAGGNIELPGPKDDPESKLYRIIKPEAYRRAYVNHFATCPERHRHGGRQR